MVKQYDIPETTTEPTARAKHERPFALKVVCALLMFDGIGFLLLVALSIAASLVASETAKAVTVTVSSVIDGFGVITELVILTVAGAALVGVSIGLWRLNPWAWRWTMIAVGALLVFNLWNYYSNDRALASSIALLIDILIVFYLIQPEVRRLFIDKPKNAALPTAS